MPAPTSRDGSLVERSARTTWNLSGLELRQSAGLRDHLAVRGENARHPHQVEHLDPRVAQGQLETLQLVPVLADAVGKEDFLSVKTKRVRPSKCLQGWQGVA